MHDAGAERGVAIEPLGETLLLLRFGERIDADVNARVHRAAALLRAAQLPGLIDLVPAYATLGLVYAPALWARGPTPPWQHFSAAVEAALARTAATRVADSATIDIPVHYGGAGGPDLDEVGRHCGLSADEVIQRHLAGRYAVAMIGFAPGFTYLLGLDAALHTPRRANPRTRVPRGSVAIGGAQTGIYPSQLPGGWNLLGRTPLRLFDARREPPCLLAPGDHVRFRAIDAQEFAVLDALDTPNAQDAP